MFRRGVGHVLAGRLPAARHEKPRSRGRCSPAEGPDPDSDSDSVLQLCADRYYISPGPADADLFRRGLSCGYGPLGRELRRNLLEQWWRSVTGSRAQVFGVNTLSSGGPGPGGLRLVEAGALERILGRSDLSREQLVREIRGLIRGSPSLRTDLFTGKPPPEKVDCHFGSS